MGVCLREAGWILVCIHWVWPRFQIALVTPDLLYPIDLWHSCNGLTSALATPLGIYCFVLSYIRGGTSLEEIDYSHCLFSPTLIQFGGRCKYLTNSEFFVSSCNHCLIFLPLWNADSDWVVAFPCSFHIWPYYRAECLGENAKPKRGNFGCSMHVPYILAL